MVTSLRRLSLFAVLTVGGGACGGSFVSAIGDAGDTGAASGPDTGSPGHGGDGRVEQNDGGGRDVTVHDETGGGDDSGPPLEDGPVPDDVASLDGNGDDGEGQDGGDDAGDGGQDAAEDAPDGSDAAEDTGPVCTSGGTTCDTPSTCPAPSNQCEIAACDDNCCTTSDKTTGTPCTTAGGKVCDDSGHCVACVVAGDCPTSTDPCETATCSSAHVCGSANVVAGTRCNQNGGNVCDSDGQCVACNVPTDCAPTGTSCIESTCTNHACGTMNAPSETRCNDNGGAVCDGNGNCVACVTNGDCPLPAETCTNNMCGL
jgi:hypothetical protein